MAQRKETARMLDGKHRMFARGVGAPVGWQISKEALPALHVKPPGGAQRDFVFGEQGQRSRKSQAGFGEEDDIGAPRRPAAQHHHRGPAQDEQGQDQPVPRGQGRLPAPRPLRQDEHAGAPGQGHGPAIQRPPAHAVQPELIGELEDPGRSCGPRSPTAPPGQDQPGQHHRATHELQWHQHAVEDDPGEDDGEHGRQIRVDRGARDFPPAARWCTRPGTPPPETIGSKTEKRSTPPA